MSEREGLAALVAGKALRMGLPELSALVLGEVAGVGGDHWRTDVALQAAISARTGWRPHRESIGRTRRRLALAGFLKSKRIFTGQKPSPAARFASAHGTTRTVLLWNVFGLRPPPRAEQRAARRKNDYEPAGPVRTPGPRHSAAAPLVTLNPPPAGPLPAELAELAERIGARIERRESARDAAADARTVLGVERAKSRPPPD